MGRLIVLMFAVLINLSCTEIEVFDTESFGMEFVAVPQGSFQMGAPSGEQGTEPDERPVHTVTFNYEFEIMTTEVTQRMWLEVMGSNPSHFSGLDKPVEMVSWNDCQDFVDVMNNLDPSHAYHLPSEAEWEYCCRAGTITRFYWGADWGDSTINGNAWWSVNSGGMTHEVANKLPNSWGIYDMSGNVWEWCEDWYHSNYNEAPSNGSAWLIPQDSCRVNRGGSWYTDAQYCRSSCRNYCNPSRSYYGIGFRLVRSYID